MRLSPLVRFVLRELLDAMDGYDAAVSARRYGHTVESNAAWLAAAKRRAKIHVAATHLLSGDADPARVVFAERMGGGQ